MDLNAEQLATNAELALNQGRLPDAHRLATEAIQLDSSSRRALMTLAMTQARLGKTPEAIENFKRVFEVDKKSFDAVFWLSMLYRKVGRLQDSIQFAQRAADIRPEEANVLANLGLSQMAAQELNGAVASFQRAAELDPNLAPNQYQLGMALQLQGRDKESEVAFRKATDLAPRSLESWLALGQCLASQNQPEEAVECAQWALAIDPNSANAHLLIAGALIDENRTAEAESHVAKAISLNPRESNAHAMLGLRLQALGKLTDAADSFRRSIEIQPKQGFAYCALMRNQKVKESDQQVVEQMEELLKTTRLPPRGQIFLHFGLGKAYEDLRDFGRAMKHFDEANNLAYRLKFGDKKFDKIQYKAVVDWTISTFNKEFFERYASAGSDSTLPLLILGMMRSGTTLVEQIVSSHPQVEATGEQHFWIARWPDAIRPGAASIDRTKLAILEEEYLKVLKTIAPKARFATDKMPGNYNVLGMIHTAFPGSRFIHTRRNAADTCISIYTTPNRAANEWAHNRENIVFVYEQYLRLMEHWNRVIPEDLLLTVSYEELVQNSEPVTRRIVEFCGLDWDDRCLHPEDNERTVVTPSVWQVRQPVYKTSMERWRNYEPWLGAFKKLPA